MDSELHAFCTELTADRERGQEFSAEARAAMIALLLSGKSQTEVAALFNVSSASVSYTKQRWAQHHNNKSRPREGRPRKLSGRQII